MKFYFSFLPFKFQLPTISLITINIIVTYLQYIWAWEWWSYKWRTIITLSVTSSTDMDHVRNSIRDRII